MTSNESSKASKKSRKQAGSSGSGEEMPELTKEETEIARHLRLDCPKKQGNLVGMKVDFFIASKLVDCLMVSKWGPGTLTPPTNKSTSTKQPLFASRQACANFMQRLMNKQLFYRAVKVYKEPAAGSEDATPNVRKRKPNKEAATTSTITTTGTPQPSPQPKEAKRKFKLEMHEEQRFLDANEPYVWVYDPASTKTYIIGSLLILGTIGICLFPLWPSQVREGVYYLSLAGASFLGAILGLAALKYVLFGALWALTLGKVEFWLFPNLTEDVGFFESFVPVYKCNCSKSAVNAKPEETNTGEEPKPDEEPVEELEKVDDEKKPEKDLIEITTTTTELSKSTLEINTNSGNNSPMLKSSRKASKSNEDEGFELVGEEDLVKVKADDDSSEN